MASNHWKDVRLFYYSGGVYHVLQSCVKHGTLCSTLKLIKNPLKLKFQQKFHLAIILLIHRKFHQIHFLLVFYVWSALHVPIRVWKERLGFHDVFVKHHSVLNVTFCFKCQSSTVPILACWVRIHALCSTPFRFWSCTCNFSLQRQQTLQYHRRLPIYL